MTEKKVVTVVWHSFTASASSCAQGLAVSSVSSTVAVLLKELLGLLLHLGVHGARTLGPDVKQDQAALQHIWKGPGLKQQDKAVSARACRGQMDETGVSAGMSSWVSLLVSPNQLTAAPSTSHSPTHCSSVSASTCYHLPSDLVSLSTIPNSCSVFPKTEQETCGVVSPATVTNYCS